MKMPVMISNRSVVITIYQEELEDGSRILINSSQGNEEVVAANKEKLIKKNVVANAIITYTKGEFYDGGAHMT